MIQVLEQVASEIGLIRPGDEPFRLAFGYACAARVRHLLEEAEVVVCLTVLDEFVSNGVDDEVLRHSKREVDRLANHHRGSASINGCGHPAVSATHAVANAISGRALQAASCAAYATVYADGGYGAVAQREAFEPEFSWQLNTLQGISARPSEGMLRPNRCRPSVLR